MKEKYLLQYAKDIFHRHICNKSSTIADGETVYFGKISWIKNRKDWIFYASSEYRKESKLYFDFAIISGITISNMIYIITNETKINDFTDIRIHVYATNAKYYYIYAEDIMYCVDSIENTPMNEFNPNNYGNTFV